MLDENVDYEKLYYKYCAELAQLFLKLTEKFVPIFEDYIKQMEEQKQSKEN